MGEIRSRRYDAGVRRYFTPRCIGMHVTLIVLLPTFAWLTRWQLSRALGGNTLSWAYTFEWPLFAAYGLYMWWKLVHDAPPSEPEPRDAKADAELAAYNSYLARL